MPTVQIQPDRQTVNQGSEAELTCIVTGSPPPEIKWSKVIIIITVIITAILFLIAILS